jgi:lipid II:glycine glycyltransferase (peptidoglycan interpeptide bridge formation enzyme)
MQAGLAEPLIAEVEGQPVAAVVIFHFAGQAYYMYGMSRPVHRNKMPTYILQWEAICRSKAAGCTVYDLWGAPEIFDERDSMWGVFRFKRGLGGTVLQTMGAYDHPIRPTIYKLYNQTLPRILDFMRRRGKTRIAGMAKN